MEEYENLMKIRQQLHTVEEQRIFDNALDTLGTTFKEMILSTKNQILGNQSEAVSLDKASDALNIIRKMAIETGVEMPDFDTEEKVVTFVLKYGRYYVLK